MDVMTYRTFVKRIAQDPAFARRAGRGNSPGGVVARLGISRQAVHQALQRGWMTGIRVDDDRGNAVIVLVDEESVLERERRRA